jgi:putative MATE family efflux protein
VESRVRARDLTTGSIPRHILTLALPVVGAMGLQSVYALVDLGYVRQLGEASVAGLSVSFQAFFLVLAMAKVVGTTLLSRVSQLYGQQRIDDARRVFTRYCAVAAVIGVVAAFTAYTSADLYVSTFTEDPAARAEGLAYFRVSAITFLFQLLLVVFGDGLRSSGDFVTPVKLMVASVLTNLVLDPVLIFGLGPIPAMGISGAALATVISQMVALVLYVSRFIRGRGERDLRWVAPGTDPGMLRELIVRGIPAGLQFFLISGVLGLVLWKLKPHGPAWTAAAGGGFRIIQQGFLPVVALSVATSAIVGQNLGAGRSDRVRRASLGALGVAIAYGTLLSVGLFFGGEYAGLLFIKDPAELPVAVTYFNWSAWLGLSVGMSLVPSFVLQAAGKSVVPAGAAVFRVVVLALLIVGIPDHMPAWVFGATTATALMEGAIDTVLLFRFLAGLPTEVARPEPTLEPAK